MIRTYVSSILALHRSGTPIDDILRAVQRILETEGRRALYKKILKQTRIALEREYQAHTPQVVSATGSALTEYAHDIEAIMKELETTKTPIETKDPSLVGGFTITYNNTLVDKSHKRKLLNVYETLTK